jgi:hypothetical protein
VFSASDCDGAVLVALVLQLLLDFAVYDIARLLFNVRSGVHRIGHVHSSRKVDPKVLNQLPNAICRALALYPRHVRCLQRSVAVARAFRRYGFPAELVIGYRPQPFISHAWVELNGRVVDGPATYAHRMVVLDRVNGDSSC